MFHNLIGLYAPDIYQIPADFDRQTFVETPGFITFLVDCVSPRVTEELNGVYEMTFNYPCDGVGFADIKHGCIVVTKANRFNMKPQGFRIYSITTPIDGIVTVSCQHLSYDTAGTMLFPYEADIPGQNDEILRYKTDTSYLFTHKDTDGSILPGIFGSSVEEDEETIWLDGILDRNSISPKMGKVRAKFKLPGATGDGWEIGTLFNFKIETPTVLRAIMCDDGDEGLTTAFKGYWTFDNWDCLMSSSRGQEIDPAVFAITYKENMSAFTSEENQPLPYTHLYPFYKDGNTKITYGGTVEGEDNIPEFGDLVPIYDEVHHPDPYWIGYSENPYRRELCILPMDFTDKVKATINTGRDSISGLQILDVLQNLSSSFLGSTRVLLQTTASQKNEGKSISLKVSVDSTKWPNGGYLCKRLNLALDPRIIFSVDFGAFTPADSENKYRNIISAVLEIIPEGTVVFISASQTRPMKYIKKLDLMLDPSDMVEIGTITQTGFYIKRGSSETLRGNNSNLKLDIEYLKSKYFGGDSRGYTPYKAGFELIPQDCWSLGQLVDEYIDTPEDYPEKPYDEVKMTVGDRCYLNYVNLPRGMTEDTYRAKDDAAVAKLSKPYEDISALANSDENVSFYLDQLVEIIIGHSTKLAPVEEGGDPQIIYYPGSYSNITQGTAWVFQHTQIEAEETEAAIQRCLKQLTDEYIEKNFWHGIPKDITAAFYDTGAAQIEPGDTVHIFNEDLLAEDSYAAVITKVEYDPSSDRYTSVEYGDSAEIEGLSATIDSMKGDDRGVLSVDQGGASGKVTEIIKQSLGYANGAVKIGNNLDDPNNATYDNPNEIMVLDDPSLNKARYMWRWDSRGLSSYRINPDYTEPPVWVKTNNYSEGDIVRNDGYYYEARRAITGSSTKIFEDADWKRVKAPSNKWVRTNAISIDGTINADLIKAGTIRGASFVSEGSTEHDGTRVHHAVSINAGTGQMTLENSGIHSYDDKTLFKHAVYGKSSLTSAPAAGAKYSNFYDDDATDPRWHKIQDDEDVLVCYTWDADTPVGSSFDENTPYLKNDIVTYNSAYYIALRDIAPGPWNSKEWLPYGTRPVWKGPYDILDSSAQYKYNTTFRLDPRGNAYFAGNVQGGEIHIGEVYDEYVGATVPAFNVSPDGDVISYGNMKLAGTIEWGAGVSPTQTLYAAGSTAPTKPTAGSRWDSYPETSTTGWHRTWSSNDIFASYTWDGGNTWTEGIIVKGVPGQQGPEGPQGPKGDDGDDAVIYTIEAPDTLFHVDKDGTITPTSIICTSYKTVGNVKSAFAGYMEVVSGGTIARSSSTSTITIYGTDFASSNIAVITLYENSSKTTILASHTIGRIVDGADGGQGEPGTPGPAGDDGVSYTINATSLTFHKINGVINPSSITCTAYKTLGGGAPSLYSGYWKVECGSMTPITYSNTNNIVVDNDIFDDEDAGTIVRVSLYSNAARTNLLYIISLTLLTDGRDGVNEYIHVAYCDEEPTEDTPSTGIHQTPQTGDTWIGTYTGTKAQWGDVNWVTEATWAYFKGEPGSDAEVTAWNTFNALTDGGRMQGIFYDPPLTEDQPEPTDETKLYINASAIKGTTGAFDYLFAKQLIGEFNDIQDTTFEVYTPSKTYNKGDIVLYPNSGSSQHEYRAKEDGITGTWNVNKWEDLGAPGDRYLDIYSDHIIMHGNVYFAPGVLQDGVTVISGDDIKTGTISANRINVPAVAGLIEEGLSLNSYPPQILQYTNHDGDIEMDSQNEWIIPKASVTTAAQTGWASFTIPADCNTIYIGSYSNGSWPAGSSIATQYLVISKDDTTIRNYYYTTPSKGIREDAISVTPGSTVRLDFTFVGGSVGLSTGWAGIQVRTASRNSSVIQLRGSSGLISAAEINIVGMVKFTDLLETGTTVINGANIITGSIKADKIDATNLHVTAANIDGTLTASQIDATNLHVKAGNIDELIIADQLTLLDGSKFDIQTPASFGQLAAKEISVEGSIDTRHAVHANALWLNEQTITSGSVGGVVQTERYKVTCTAVSGSSNKFKVRLTRTTIGYYNYSDSLTFNFYYKLVASGPIKGYVSKSVQFNISASETLNVYDEHEIELTPERSPLLVVYRYTFDSVVGTETIASDGTFQRLARSGSLLYPEKVVILNSSICGIDTSSIQTYSPLRTYTKGELVQWMNMSTLTNQIYKCKIERAYNISPGDPDHGGDTWQYVDNASSTSSLCNLGSTYRRWDNTYLRHNPDVSSDANVKHDIDVIDDKYDVMFDNLRPTQFMYNGGDRIHLGLIAQEVEEAMQAAGIDNTEFGGFCKDSTEDGDIYGLRYGEFIGLLIKEVQTLKKRVNQLEQGENENEGNETEPDTAEETLGTEIQ